MSRSTDLIKNVFSLGLVQVSNLVLPLISLPIISRIIGPEKYGIINYASAVIAYFTLIINYGFDMTASREVAQNCDNLDKVNGIFSNILYTKILLFICSCFLFLLSIYFLPGLENEKLVAIYTYLICIGWVITPNWLYQGMQQLHRIAILNVLSKLIFTVAILLIIKEKNDYYLQPLVFSFSQILVGVISFVWAFKLYHIKLLKFQFRKIVKTLNDGKSIFFSLLTINLYTYTSVVVLGFFNSSTEVGYYTAANRLISVAQAVMFAPINQALFPFIGSAFGRSKEEGLNMIKKVFPSTLIISFLYCCLLLLFSRIMVKIIFGPSFNSAVTILQLLSFVPFIINCSTVLGIQAMVNLKMDKSFFHITLIGACISLPLNFLASKYFGAIGTAISYVIIEVMICFMFYMRLKKDSINIIDYEYFKLGFVINQVKKIGVTNKAPV